MTAVAAAGAGFLLAVLWFDLMFDVQLLRHRAGEVPEAVLTSIAGYYGRVTTGAAPMNRLVALAMGVTVAALVVEVAGDDVPAWAAWLSLGLAAVPVLLAGGHTVPNAVRLGRRSDPPDRQGALARSILRDHLACLAAIAALLVVQLVFAQ